jgi:hypothetical protein
MSLIYTLILFFVFLLVYQIYLDIFSSKLIEGLETNSSTTSSSSSQEYKPYNLNDPNNSLILSQQNAGNIEVLKGRIETLDGINQKVDNIQLSIDAMQIQIDGLVQQQADYAQELAGSTPPTVTGTDELTVEDTEAIIEEEED